MALRLGRKTKYDQPLTEMVRVLFTESQLPELAEFAAQSGASDVSTWLREIALGEREHPLAEPASPSSRGGVFFELNELDQKELARLAEDTLKLDDPNLFARLVIRRALDMGPDVMREFLLGQARREVAANLEAENQARAEKETSARQKTETTKNAPRKARKAA